MFKKIIFFLIVIFFSQNAISSTTISGGNISGGNISNSDTNKVYKVLRGPYDYKVLIGNASAPEEAGVNPVVVFLSYQIDANGIIFSKHGFFILQGTDSADPVYIGRLNAIKLNQKINFGDIDLPAVWKYVFEGKSGTLNIKSIDMGVQYSSFEAYTLDNDGKDLFKGYVYERDVYRLEKILLKTFPSLYSDKIIDNLNKLIIKEQIAYTLGSMSDEWKVSKLSDLKICSKAKKSIKGNIFEYKWNNNSYMQKYVKEAKRRNLACGIKEENRKSSEEATIQLAEEDKTENNKKIKDARIIADIGDQREIQKLISESETMIIDILEYAKLPNKLDTITLAEYFISYKSFKNNEWNSEKINRYKLLVEYLMTDEGFILYRENKDQERNLIKQEKIDDLKLLLIKYDNILKEFVSNNLGSDLSANAITLSKKIQNIDGNIKELDQLVIEISQWFKDNSIVYR